MVGTLFSGTKFSWLWLIVRVFVGIQWLVSSFNKLVSPEWIQTGEAVKSLWMSSIAVPAASAKPSLLFDWYRTVIQTLLNHHAYLCFGKFIAVGELLIGLALILGFLVGISAFFGGLINLSFLLTGSISYGPVILVLELLLLVAWKTAGYYGLDRYFFKFIGAPWKSGKWFQKKLA